MIIHIYSEIVEDCLGYGWVNVHDTALTLAGYMESIWKQDLIKCIENGDTINIDIGIRENALTSTPRKLIVNVEKPLDYQTSLNVKALLTNPDIILKQFINSPMATALMKED